MRLENLLALTNAELVSSPFVKIFESIVFEAKQVKRGDLFFAYNEDEIEEAVFNGAYGIVFSKPTQIIDREIAWIKVKDLDTALRRILRFDLLNKELNVYSCESVTLKLAAQIITESSFVVLLSNDARILFKELALLEPKTTLLFCRDITDDDIFTEVHSLPKASQNVIEIIEQTLFETSFIYDNTFYERQLLSPFFIPFLEELLLFFKKRQIAFRLKKFTPIDHFEAVFVNKKFEIKEFGSSEQVLIFEKEDSLIEKEIRFLLREARWAETLFVVSQKIYKMLATDLQKLATIIVYNESSEIKELLREHSFHFALVAGVEKSILNEPLKLHQQSSLFDIF